MVYLALSTPRGTVTTTASPSTTFPSDAVTRQQKPLGEEEEEEEEAGDAPAPVTAPGLVGPPPAVAAAPLAPLPPEDPESPLAPPPPPLPLPLLGERGRFLEAAAGAAVDVYPAATSAKAPTSPRAGDGAGAGAGALALRLTPPLLPLPESWLVPPLSLSWLAEPRLSMPAPARPPDAVDAAAPVFAGAGAGADEEPPPVTAAAASAGGEEEEDNDDDDDDDDASTNPSLSLNGAFSTEEEAATAPPGLSPTAPAVPGCCVTPLAGGGSIALSPAAAACRP